ncbi:MAG: DUF2147 domain-containing protein [Rhodobacterales bacterium]|nr:DUF2147 domain-containing protein [Rhodobacterales bacterium]
MGRAALAALLLAAALPAAPRAAAADPVEGLWQTRPDDNGNFGHVRIAPCGAAFCGVLERAFDGAGGQIASPNLGRQILWDIRALGDGTYGEGRIWAPDRDRTYVARLRLTDQGLAVEGCVLGICRQGGTWTRVP